MFLKGEFEGKFIDNTSEAEVSAWLELLKAIKPKEVMIYTIDRETPAEGLKKAPYELLQKIASRVEELGIRTNVAG
jgi:hypothetical protein